MLQFLKVRKRHILVKVTAAHSLTNQTFGWKSIDCDIISCLVCRGLWSSMTSQKARITSTASIRSYSSAHTYMILLSKLKHHLKASIFGSFHTQSLYQCKNHQLLLIVYQALIKNKKHGIFSEFAWFSHYVKNSNLKEHSKTWGFSLAQMHTSKHRFQ